MSSISLTYIFERFKQWLQRRNGRRPHGESQYAQSGCDCRLVEDQAYEFHPSAAHIELEYVDFECAFEKLCPGDAFSFAAICSLSRGFSDGLPELRSSASYRICAE